MSDRRRRRCTRGGSVNVDVGVGVDVGVDVGVGVGVGVDVGVDVDVIAGVAERSGGCYRRRWGLSRGDRRVGGFHPGKRNGSGRRRRHRYNGG